MGVAYDKSASKAKRRSLSLRRKAVTVCIAGINYASDTPCIITASDRKVSFLGGYFAAEGVAMKITKVNDDWGLMFSGTNSPLVPVVETIKERCDKMRATELKSFARTCSVIYREERKEI